MFSLQERNYFSCERSLIFDKCNHSLASLRSNDQGKKLTWVVIFFFFFLWQENTSLEVKIHINKIQTLHLQAASAQLESCVMVAHTTQLFVGSAVKWVLLRSLLLEDNKKETAGSFSYFLQTAIQIKLLLAKFLHRQEVKSYLTKKHLA